MIILIFNILMETEGKKIKHINDAKLPIDQIDPVDKIFYNWCQDLAPICYQLKLTPNIITTISLLFKIIAVYYLYHSNILYFTFFYFIQYLFDCLDGTVARKYKQYSEYGDLYDHSCDFVYALCLLYLIYVKYKFQNKYNIVYLLFFGISLYRFTCVSKIVKNKNQTGIPYEKICPHSIDKIPTLISMLKLFGEGMITVLAYIYIIHTHHTYLYGYTKQQ